MTQVTLATDRLLSRAQVFFFCSGATGLVYQVLWTRRLTLTFGHTVLAVSTVLTAFMAGLALGSLLAGYWTDRSSRSSQLLLASYGWLEGAVGLWALLTLTLLNLVERLYVDFAARGVEGGALHLGCFIAAALVLVPPTAAMGATLPLLAKLLVQSHQEVGPILSRLYGLNTLGALVGAFLGGFVLLPRVGLNGSMILAVSVNLALAAAAVRESRRGSEEASDPQEVPSKRRKRKSRMTGPASANTDQMAGNLVVARWIVPATFGLAGGASMAYQVAWNRSICLAIGSSVYAFSAILVTFLGGLALGSLLYQRFFRNRVVGINHLGWLYLAVACSGGFTVQAVSWLPEIYLKLAPWVGQSFLRALASSVGLAALLLFLPTFFMGLGFPLATAAFTPSVSRLGRSVGQVYGANTLGCIFGAFITGFILVPQLGAQWSLKIATLAYLLLFLVVAVWAGNGHRRLVKLVFSLALGFAIVNLPTWDPAVMTSGVAVYAQKYIGDNPEGFSMPTFYKDGLSSAVSFHLAGEFWDLPNMRVNGKVDASVGEGDRLTQYMLGYLPTLLHPEPKRVAIVGLGGGFTVEAVSQIPGVRTIDVAELEPAVLEAGEYWKPYNNRVLEDPRVKVTLQDGRTFVSASAESFDVIISEPSNPWIAGIGSLFTRDFYEAAKHRLAARGIMCQWFNLYHVSQSDTTMVIRTFFAVFPQGSMWQSSGGDLILIGSQDSVNFDLARVRQIWSESLGIQKNFFLANLYKPEYLPAHYLMSRDEALTRVGKGPINTDDLPLLEFSAPASLYRQGFRDTLDLLWNDLTPSLPPEVPRTKETLHGILFGLLNREDYAGLRKALGNTKGGGPDVLTLAAKAEALEHPDDLSAARKLYSDVQKTYPNNSYNATLWGDLEFQQGNFVKSAELYLTALAAPLPGSEAYLCLRSGQSLLKLQDFPRSLEPLLVAGSLTPTESLPLSLAGRALVSMQRDEEALEFLKTALERNPYDPLANEYMGYALFNLGRTGEARRYLEELVRLVPGYDPGWLKLAVCYKQLGNRSSSQDAFERALELEPENEQYRKDLED